jgi:hypothetical protein
MHWNTELAYFVTPKSGPMRPMRTLVDVNRALLDDLPFVARLRPHWAAVARLLLIAADTASTIDVRLATDALVRALEVEGWMTRTRVPGALPPAADTRPSVAASVGQSGGQSGTRGDPVAGAASGPPAAAVSGAVPDLILRTLPAGPAGASATIGGRQGRGTRRPVDTKL